MEAYESRMAEDSRALLMNWLSAKRAHVREQVEAMAEADRRSSRLPSGWTPLGLVSHLTLDVERFWFRAVLAGEQVELPEGYEGWTADPGTGTEEILAAYAEECRAVDALIADMPLEQAPAWWPMEGDPPFGSLHELLIHVLVETATHAGQLDVARELADGGQRLVFDTPD